MSANSTTDWPPAARMPRRCRTCAFGEPATSPAEADRRSRPPLRRQPRSECHITCIPYPSRRTCPSTLGRVSSSTFGLGTPTACALSSTETWDARPNGAAGECLSSICRSILPGQGIRGFRDSSSPEGLIGRPAVLLNGRPGPREGPSRRWRSGRPTRLPTARTASEIEVERQPRVPEPSNIGPGVPLAHIYRVGPRAPPRDRGCPGASWS